MKRKGTKRPARVSGYDWFRRYRDGGQEPPEAEEGSRPFHRIRSQIERAHPPKVAAKRRRDRYEREIRQRIANAIPIDLSLIVFRESLRIWRNREEQR